jgi:hypothetical protein
MSEVEAARLEARLATVEEHVRCDDLTTKMLPNSSVNIRASAAG